MHRLPQCLVSVALAVVPVSSAHAAQAPDTLRLDPAHRAALEARRDSLEGAHRLEIIVGRGRQLRRAQATRLQITPGGLALLPLGVHDLPPSVAAETRLRIAIARSGVGRGARVGALVGALAGVGLGFFAAGIGCIDATEGCNASFLEGMVIVGGIGAGAGALLGAGFGFLLPRWETVYDHPP